MPEEHQKPRSLFVQDGTEGEIDLWKTRRSALMQERVAQAHICIVSPRLSSHDSRCDAKKGDARSCSILRSMLGLHGRPNKWLHTSLKYLVTSSISCLFKSVTMMCTSSHPESCIPLKSISSGNCIKWEFRRWLSVQTLSDDQAIKKNDEEKTK